MSFIEIILFLMALPIIIFAFLVLFFRNNGAILRILRVPEVFLEQKTTEMFSIPQAPEHGIASQQGKRNRHMKGIFTGWFGFGLLILGSLLFALIAYL